MLRRITKKRAIVALSVVAVLAMAGAAIAYFTSQGDGTGQASVGTASAFKVDVSAPTGGPLLPGSGSENLAYTVTNQSDGTQNLSTSSATVASSNGNITQNGAEVTDCKASWFSVSNNAPTYGPLAGHAQVTNGSVNVTMPDNTVDNQDACKGAHPDISVHVG